MTTTDGTYKNNTMLQNLQKKANIHDIIKKEIHQKQGRISNQTSPVKKSHINLGDQDYYKGIDISSSRSPFKNVNKQTPAKADGMPLETDSNVYDDVQD